MRIKVLCGCNAVTELNENALSRFGTEITCSNCGKSFPPNVRSAIFEMLSASSKLTAAIQKAPEGSIKLKSIKL